MRAGATIEWHQYPDRGSANEMRGGFKRTGRVWSESPYPGYMWVVPDERLPGEYDAILVRTRASGSQQGRHEVIEDSDKYRQYSSEKWVRGSA